MNMLALFGSLAIFAIAIAGLSGRSFDLVLPGILPIGGGLALGMDRLSAFFLLIIAAGVIPSALYAIGYTRQYKDRQASMAVAFNAFIAAMVLVVLARNVLTFLVFWEAMSLASYFLVMSESDRADTRSAGWLYAVMTHAGLACLLIGFLMISRETGSLRMSDWSRAAAMLDHHRKRAPLGAHNGTIAEKLRGAGGAVTDHDHVDAHRLEILGRVHQRLAFRDGRAGRRHVDRVRRQPLLGELEGDAGARGCFEKEIDDGFAAERRDFLDRPLGDFLERLRRIENEPDLLRAHVLEAGEVFAERRVRGHWIRST